MGEQQLVRELGEFELIGLITKGIVATDAVQLGPGDDAAVLRVPSGRVVISTDSLVENVHFKRAWSGGLEVGRKAIAVAAADLEAMGATPTGVVVALTTPGDLPVTWLRYLVQGVHTECERAGLALIGGDVTSGSELVLAVTVLGEASRVITRSGAAAGEVVAYRGRLGWAAAGLAVLGRGFRSPRAAVEAQLVPEVPYGAGREAAAAGATAMLDVSDGLLADLGHLARSSGVAIDLDPAAFEIPDPVRAVAAATGADALSFVLTGGEDHALAATFAAGNVPAGWRVIGRVLDGDGVTLDGQAWEGRQGFSHFG